MDIKAKIEELVEKLKSDDKLMEKFQKDPIGTIEGLIGIDLPDEQLDAVVKGVMAKIDVEEVAKKAGGIIGWLKGLLGKK